MTPKTIRRLINLWPPLLFSGIRVRSVSADWTQVEAELRLTWGNRNAVGTMFGGSLFAMTDPFYPLMLQHNLGPGYAVWTKSAQIEFFTPGRGIVRANFNLTGTQIEEILAATADGQSHLPRFSTTIMDLQGQKISEVSTVLYVRRKPVGGH
jgi:acyl-coenzyme A thioesterase PaaI-like protein